MSLPPDALARRHGFTDYEQFIRVKRERALRLLEALEGGLTTKRVPVYPRPEVDRRTGRWQGVAGGTAPSLAVWERERRSEEKRMQPPEPVMVQPVVRLTERGIDWGTLPGPADEVGYGMHPFRGDDCFRTAVATAIQAPIEQVPDGFVSLHWAAGEDPLEVALRVWRRMIRWAAARGLELMIHRDVPVLRERWIGVVRDQALFDRLVAEAKADPDRLIAGAKANPEKFRGLARRTPEEIVEAAEAAPEKLGNWIGGLPHALVMSYGRIVFDPSCTFRPPPGSVVDRWNLSDVVFGISFDRMEE